MHFIDLSHPINNNTPVFPGTPAVKITNFATIQNDGFREKELFMPTHTGTHMDAPAHMLANGPRLDQLELSAFSGTAAVIDIRQSTAKAAGMEMVGNLPDMDFILFRTDMAFQWGKASYFEGHPFPGPELAEQLARMPIKGVGIDAVSIDAMDSTTYYNHKTLLQKEILIIENLTNLQCISAGRFWFTAMPLPIEDADGSPVRAYATLEKPYGM